MAEPTEKTPTLEELQTQNAALQKQLEDKTTAEAAAAQQKAQEEAAALEAEERKKRLELDDEDFLPESYKSLSEEDFEAIVSDKDRLGSFINETVNGAFKKAVSTGHELALEALPGIVTPIASQQMQSQSMVQRFWNENEDLRDHGQFVLYMYQQLDKPGSTPEQVFQQLEPSVREALNKPKPNTLPTGGKSGGRSSTDPPSGKEDDVKKEIDKVFGLVS